MIDMEIEEQRRVRQRCHNKDKVEEMELWKEGETGSREEVNRG